MHKVYTLCFVRDDTRVLLGMKKRGFGEGRWNGFGGKVTEGESIEEGAKRELLEECGLTATQLAKKAVLSFQFPNDPAVLTVHVFEIRAWSGEPVEGEEMRPKWYALDAIPYDAMWSDDRYWLPQFLEGKALRGSFQFGPNDSVASHSLEEVSPESL